jgi:hypothetical protein
MPERARTTRRGQDPDQGPEELEGENFDLHNISGGDDDDEGPPIPRTQAAARAQINPVAQVIVNDPEPSISKKNTAQDVWHFFSKTDGYSVCQVCKYVKHL